MSASSPISALDQLLAQARFGDPAAVEQLLAEYRPYLHLLAEQQIRHRFAGRVDASDVVQEACLRVGQAFPEFGGNSEAELLAWLRRILASSLTEEAHRQCATRRQAVRLEIELADALDQSSQFLAARLASPGNSPSQSTCRREQLVLLSQALSHLPEDYRQVLVLRHLEGLSFPDVAQHMGRSLDSVKHLWVRALARIRCSFGGLP